ncbi:MAG: MlaD family protein [Pseudomonadota bacterium]
METRANYIAIGLFTILVCAMTFGFIYWLDRYNETGEARTIDLVLPANAGGLNAGSGVLFNGLRVGSVTRVEYRVEDPQNIYAKLRVSADIPLRSDTTISVSSQPLTGLTNVTMVGGTPDAPLLFDEEGTPVLRATTSSLAETIEAAGKAVATANEVLLKVDNLLTENIAPISETVQNVQKFSTALANNADGIDELLQNFAETSSAINALGVTVSGVSDDIEAIVAAIEPDRIRSTLENVDKITTDFAASSGEIGPIVEDAKTTVATLVDIAENLRTTTESLNDGTLNRILKNVEGLTVDLSATVEKADGVLAAVDPDVVSTTLTNIRDISDSFSQNTDEIDQILVSARTTLDDFTKVSSKLVETSEVLDSDQLKRTLDNVETFTGGVNETLGKVDEVLTALDQEKIANLITSLEGFAGRLNDAGEQIDSIIANAETATKDVTVFTNTLAENSESIDSVIADARTITGKLVGTADSINRLIGRVDGLVEADGDGLIVEATKAAESIRKIADSFEARADRIAGGLENFSTRGLSDIETLIGESRQAVSRVDSILRNLESNPTQFLLSGQKVPEYRQRR